MQVGHLNIMTFTLVLSCCSADPAAAVAAWVVSGRAPLCSLALPLTVECSKCTGSNALCLSRNPVQFKALDAIVDVLAKLPSARLADETPLLVTRLVTGKHWSELAALCVALPLTAAPVAAEWVDFATVDWGTMVNAHGLRPVLDFAKSGILDVDVERVVYNVAPTTLRAAQDKLHLLAYCRWLSKREHGACQIAGVEAAVRFVLNRHQIPHELVTHICRLSGCT